MTLDRADWLVPAFIIVCIILGGASAGGYIANAILQLLAIGLLATAWISRRDRRARGNERWLWLLVAAGMVLILAQFVPLPVSLWRELPGRSEIAAQLDVAGIRQSYAFVSFIPHESFKSAVWLLPALGILCVMLRARTLFQERYLAIAITSTMCVAVIVAALQLSQGTNSPLYFYEVTNRGSAVGFFANTNHMASLLLVTIPFQAALLKEALERNDQKRLSGVFAILGTMAVTLAGIAVNGSLAGYGLLLPVCIASCLILSEVPRVRGTVMLLLIAVLLAGLAILFATAEGSIMLDAAGAMPADSRQTIFATSWHAIKDMWPLGSGIGTFAELYASYEDPGGVIHIYINHAHNDYIELVLETGIAGAALMALFLVWWGISAVRIWRDPWVSPYVLAAVVASATLLVHTLVDYPLRTAAMSSIFAISIALMAAGNLPARRLRPERTEGWGK